MKKKLYLIGLLLTAIFLSSCGQKKAESIAKEDKYRTFYEIFVYSFYDTDADGIGDLKGVTKKLDYLNDGNDKTDSDLGITGIWLMPIMPSTTYHKYDVTDYYSIDPEYGNMEDFEELISECNKRNINVIIDLVMNHTSSKHPWFTEACDYLKKLPEGEEPDLEECPYVGYYHFKRGMEWGWYQLEDTDWYYEAGFWSEMPDLNLFDENVRKEFEDIARFWLDKGVSGFRLDAVKEFVSDNTEANVDILSWFNHSVKAYHPNAYIVGEAWTSQPEYAKYYASGIDSLFDFAFAGSEGYTSKFARGTYNALDLGDYLTRENDRFLEQNENYINAPFYSNHDMDRAASYYSGDNAQSQAKMALALNLTMSGNAFIYYGDEIGMLGTGKDENKRLAMRWSLNNTEGLCLGPKDADSGIEQIYDSLDKQMEDADSIYNWTRKVIALRNKYPAIRKGNSYELKKLSNSNVVTIVKEYEGKRTGLIYNFSSQTDTIDLAKESLEDGRTISEKDLQEKLICNGGDCLFEGSLLTLPAYSIFVFDLDK